MAKLVALYKHAEDQEAFDKHYAEVHMPLTEKMPNLKKVNTTYFVGTPMGQTAPFYMQTDLHFDNLESLKASMSSPEGKAAAKDLIGFAGSLVTMMLSDD